MQRTTRWLEDLQKTCKKLLTFFAAQIQMIFKNFDPPMDKILVSTLCLKKLKKFRFYFSFQMTKYLLIATAIINTLSGAIAVESYSFIQHHEPRQHHHHHSSYNSPFVSHSHYSKPESHKYGITPDQHSHYYA